VWSFKKIKLKVNHNFEHYKTEREMLTPIPVKSYYLLLFVKKVIVVKKHNNSYLGLVTLSCGWKSPIVIKFHWKVDGSKQKKQKQKTKKTSTASKPGPGRFSNVSVN
jgi:hypothetical protein